MALDSYVAVAPDSTGKKMTTDQSLDALGNVIQIERARIVGDEADAIIQLVAISQAQLAALRQIAALLATMSNAPQTEEDFTLIP